MYTGPLQLHSGFAVVQFSYKAVNMAFMSHYTSIIHQNLVNYVIDCLHVSKALGATASTTTRIAIISAEATKVTMRIVPLEEANLPRIT